MIRLAEGVYSWGYFNTEKKYNFNGFLLATGTSVVVVDPPTLSRDDEAYYDQLGLVPDLFVITNRNHVRALDWFLKRKAAPVAMHEADVAAADIPVDRKVQDGEVLGGALEVLHLPGKSQGEIGLYWRARKLLLLGDAIIAPNGALRLIPEAKLDDPQRLRKSLQRLRDCDFDAVLMADGDPLLSDAKAQVHGFLSSLS
ncbi:MAG: MBL fold metallo-hydrolase [Elusimicrobia bacterium]|nr:MBL fold metallo-hydrolase [Elusimicrobiota bacterium]